MNETQSVRTKLQTKKKKLPILVEQKKKRIQPNYNQIVSLNRISFE